MPWNSSSPRPRAYQWDTVDKVVPRLHVLCMQIGLRHLSAGTVEWLKGASGETDRTRHSLARELCERENRRNPRGVPCLAQASKALMASEEAESVRESAPRCMDDEIDGATPSRAAQVIEELLAVDADDRALAPEARPVGWVSSVAESGGDPVEGDVAAGGRGIAAAHCRVPAKACLEGRRAAGVTRYRYPPSLGVRGGNGFR